MAVTRRAAKAGEEKGSAATGAARRALQIYQSGALPGAITDPLTGATDASSLGRAAQSVLELDPASWSPGAITSVVSAWATAPAPAAQEFLRQTLIPWAGQDITNAGEVNRGASLALNTFAGHEPALFLSALAVEPLERGEYGYREAEAMGAVLGVRYPVLPPELLDDAIIRIAELPDKKNLPDTQSPQLRAVLPPLVKRRQTPSSDGDPAPPMTLKVLDPLVAYYMRVRRLDGKHETAFHRLGLARCKASAIEDGRTMTEEQWCRLDKIANTHRHCLQERIMEGDL